MLSSTNESGHLLEELVLRHEAAGPGGQRRQHVERLGRQRNRTAIPQQATFGHVEPEVAELQTAAIVGHSGARIRLVTGESSIRTRRQWRANGPQIDSQSQIKPFLCPL